LLKSASRCKRAKKAACAANAAGIDTEVDFAMR
jgi:hypothetical protein